MLAISRLCLAKALLLRSVTSPSLSKNLKIEVEGLVQFPSPVIDQALLAQRRNAPGQFVPGSKLP